MIEFYSTQVTIVVHFRGYRSALTVFCQTAVITYLRPSTLLYIRPRTEDCMGLGI